MATYLFDFDGTLVDSMPNWAKQMLSILDDYNVDYPDDIIKTVTPLGNNASVEYFINIGLPLPFDTALKLAKERLTSGYLYDIPAKSNVEMVIKELKHRGHSLNILTASPHSMMDPCLKRLGLFEFFDNIWSCEDFDFIKSQPEIYMEAAKRLSIPISEMIFIDDNYIADSAAKKAGATVYGVYDESSHDMTEKIQSITDRYINDFKELL